MHRFTLKMQTFLKELDGFQIQLGLWGTRKLAAVIENGTGNEMKFHNRCSDCSFRNKFRHL